MRIIVGAVAGALLLVLVPSVRAQQPDSLTSLDRVRLLLERAQQQPTLITPLLEPWATPAPRRLGVLTLLPPQKDGQLISVAVPIGDLASRAARAVSSARHRRAERKAGERVQRALWEFQAQPPVR